jgi:hypothetical protein
MDQTSIDFDQNDEDILTYAVSDEALEATADRETSPAATILSFIPVEIPTCC